MKNIRLILAVFFAGTSACFTSCQTHSGKTFDATGKCVITEYLRLKSDRQLPGVTPDTDEEFSVYRLDDQLLQHPSMDALVELHKQCKNLYVVDATLATMHRTYAFCCDAKQPRYLQNFVLKDNNWVKSSDNDAAEKKR